MTSAIEIYYHTPTDVGREQAIKGIVATFNGTLVFREESLESICLTTEFPSENAATSAAAALREAGEYVEGPMDYGD